MMEISQAAGLFLDAPIALFRASPVGKILDVNPALVALLGYPDRETLLAAPLETLYDPTTSRAAEVNQAFDGPAGVVTTEVEAIHYGGRRILLQASIRPVLDETGVVQHYEGGLIEITEQGRARQSLARSESRYRHLFNSSQVALFEEDFSGLVEWLELLRADGISELEEYLAEHPAEVERAAKLVKVSNVNPSALRLVGADTVEELSAGFAELITDASRESFLGQLLTLWAGDERYEAEISGQTLDGKPMDLLLAWVIPHDADSSDLSRVVVSISDISEQRNRERALAQAERHFRGVIESAPIGMALVSPNGFLRLVNAALIEMFGYTRLELEMMDWTFLLGSDSTDRADLMSKLLTGQIEEAEFENPVKRADGHRVWIRVKVSVLPSEAGSSPVPIVQVVDETRQKTAQSELETLLASRDQLISSVSHAVRTPLTAVVGFVKLLRDDAGSLDEFETTELLSEIYNESMSMSHLMYDLLVMARTQAGSLRPVAEEVDVGATATTAAESIIGTETIDWELTGSATAYVDRLHLIQILRNLLTNAGEQAEREVRFEVSQENGRVTVSVGHDGPGVPSDSRDQLFEPFSLPADASSPSPLGLGLTVARRLALLNGGYVSYEENEAGPRYILTLPSDRAGVTS